MEKEFAVEPFDRDWDYVFTIDKVERGIGVVEKRLSF